MTTRNELDRSISVWLEAEAPGRAPDDVLEASRERIRHTRQRPAWLPAWRSDRMNSYAKLAAVAAAVLVVAVVGYQFLPSAPGPGGPPTATPSPSPALAVGSFISHGGQIELDAAGDGATVTGSMTYTDVGGVDLGGFTVELRCTRTSARGLIMIGGPIIESTQGYVESAPVDTNVAVVLQRGSPVKAVFWIEHPDPHEPDCSAFLESIPDLDDPELERALEPIEGTIELRP